MMQFFKSLAFRKPLQIGEIPSNRVLLEYPSAPQLPKQFHTCYGTRSSLPSSKKPANSPLMDRRNPVAHVPQGLLNDPTPLPCVTSRNLKLITVW